MKRAVGYRTRAPAESLLIPRFKIGYMKDSIALRGAVLWNTLTSKTVILYIQLVIAPLKRKLISLGADHLTFEGGMGDIWSAGNFL